MSVECPFSPKVFNERAVRLVAFFTLSLMVAGLFSSLKWVALFLCLDFFVRGFTDWPVSPLRALAKSIVKTLHLPPKMINAGPKIFAARIGCIFPSIIALAASMELDLVATVLAALLILLAGLEAFFSLCVGCHIYSLLQTLKKAIPAKK